MNYYIDFDSTLYETTRLSNDMLMALVNELCKVANKSEEDMFAELKAMFNRENIYNIYKLAKYFANEYNLEEKFLVNVVEGVIADGEKYVYPDSIAFLKMVKEKGHTVNILTYVAQEDLTYQMSKLKGSGLSEYFDNVIITSSLKFNLDLKYEEGIFFDDNPKDLTGIASRNPKALIRVRRKNNKYSSKELELNNLIECETLEEYTFED